MNRNVRLWRFLPCLRFLNQFIIIFNIFFIFLGDFLEVARRRNREPHKIMQNIKTNKLLYHASPGFIKTQFNAIFFQFVSLGASVTFLELKIFQIQDLQQQQLFESKDMKINPNQWKSVEKKNKKENKDKKEKKIKKKQEKSSEQVQEMMQEQHAEQNKVKKTAHLLTAKEFFPTKLEMLQFPSSVDVYNRVYGHFLVNQDMKIVYADKLAKQYLQASFTPSFSSKTLLDLIVEAQREQFIKDCQDCIQNIKTPFLYLIYSRKTLRKTKYFPEIQKSDNYDIFFRYMKCLRSIITPILIDLSQYQQFKDDNNFWNDSLIDKHQKMRCYFFKVSQALYVPDIEYFDFSKDSRISKFKKLAEQGRVRKQKDKKEKQEKEKNEDPQRKKRRLEILAKRKPIKKITPNNNLTNKRNPKQEKKNARKMKLKLKYEMIEQVPEIKQIEEERKEDSQLPIPIRNQTPINYCRFQEHISQYFN